MNETALSPEVLPAPIWKPSARAEVITRRTYCRPKEDGSFETWEEVVNRVVQHQRWLWERAIGDKPLSAEQTAELEELRALLLQRKASISGRTLWLGGTEVARRREASNFNCAFSRVESIYDVVDCMWLLLQGCGVGFEPVIGNLSGFTQPVEVEVVRSQRHLLTEPRGREHTLTTFEKGVWTISIGDSAESWAKAPGKLLAMKKKVKKIVLDFQQIRPAGYRLKGYGWISSGDETFCKALVAICEILNKRAGQLLTRIDIMDTMNWLGTTLSSRRSAESVIVPYGDPEWREFALAKRDHWIKDPQRGMSNNSLLFFTHPGKDALAEIFQMMQDAGGSEPGFVNAEQALVRAPWFKGANPCFEILLPNKGFCNLVEINLSRFNNDLEGLARAFYIMSRANYRQTCVNLDDGILQRAWHENNEYLRLLGVGITGVVSWEHANSSVVLEALNNLAVEAGRSMADELGLPHPKNTTTVKPSGTLSKIMDTTEGAHKPLGKFIFNNVRFSKHDPLLAALKKAKYRTFADPYNADGELVTFPVKYDNIEFSEIEGRSVTIESAIDQLDRYKLLMDHYVDQNCSVTISYSPEEVPAMVDWLNENWDHYVGVSFLYRTDPTKTAKDLGYPYLPQEVVTETEYESYVKTLKPVKFKAAGSIELSAEADDVDFEIDAGDECATGACPIR